MAIHRFRAVLEPPSYERELAIAQDVALAAADVLRRHRAGRLEIDYKAGDELVTAAELEADAVIRAGLARAFPDDAICTEETGDSPERLLRKRVWIVDPLDSTGNYIKRGDEFAVSIGLAVDGVAVLGVVCNPARGELFAGCEGRGATLNGAPVRASDVAGLERAQLTVSRKELRNGLAAVASSLSLRPVASMAYRLARVAAGIDDGSFCATRRKTWGICAGVALVSAAGGRASLLDGGEIRFDRRELRQPQPLVAAGRSLHPLLLATVAGFAGSLADKLA
ncbi:MAG TPA: 3'(2'),5'-bisphosphate nucleotidase CysQ [Solirubrobacteraceae bacterium]